MNTLAGTGGLIRLILRRDRVLLPLWVAPIALLPVAYVGSINGLFPTAAARAGYARASAHDAGFVALYGRLHGSSLGELVAWRAGFVPVVIGLFSALAVIRHTRAEEEAGRRELLAATVVGRHAGLAAALLVAFGADLVLGAAVALTITGQGPAPGLAAAGAWSLGAQFAGAGWVFAALAAVAAQLTTSARGARTVAAVALGVAYLLRLAGDVSGMGSGPLGWLSWLSPIGWGQQLRPYAGERWWPLALIAGLAAVLAVGAAACSGRRDVGGALLPPRLGPATAAPSLRSPLALAWRAHRGLLAGWVAGFAVLGVVLGAVTTSVADLVGDDAAVRDIFARVGGTGGLVDSYLAGVCALLGVIAAGYAVQAALRAREEETSGRAEPVLATAVGRLRWAGSHLVFAALGPTAALAAAGVAMGLTSGVSVGGTGGELLRVLGGTMAQLPAVWVLAAVTVALYGLLPRLAALGWGALGICLLLFMVGGAVRLNQWLLDVSPFTHVPHLPGGTASATPLLALCALALALAAAGLVGLRRRDLPVG